MCPSGKGDKGIQSSKCTSIPINRDNRTFQVKNYAKNFLGERF